MNSLQSRGAVHNPEVELQPPSLSFARGFEAGSNWHSLVRADGNGAEAEVQAVAPSIKAAVSSVGQRLQAASRAAREQPLSLAEENPHIDAVFDRLDANIAALNDPVADTSQTYASFLEVKRFFENTLDIPAELLANLETLASLALITSEADKPNEKKSWSVVARHFEAALPVLRASAQKGHEQARHGLAETLSLLATCYALQPRPRWGQTATLMHEAVLTEAALLQSPPEHQSDAQNSPHAAAESELPSRQEMKASLAQHLIFLSTCLHMKPQPDWPNAVHVAREAIDLFEEQGDKEELVAALRQLAWICQMQPKPDHEQAAAAYEEALKLLTAPEDAEKRADTLDRLAVCLYNHDEPQWERATGAMREAVELWRDIGEAGSEHLIEGLVNCAELFSIAPQPDYAQAASLYREALALLPHTPRNPEDSLHNLTLARAVWSHDFALCLEKQPQPNFQEAVAASRVGVAMFRQTGHKPGLLAALQQLAWFSSAVPGEDNDLALAIASYREVVSLLNNARFNKPPQPPTARATALYNLALCLHRHAGSSWSESYETARQSLRAFRALSKSREGRKGWLDAMRLLADICFYNEGNTVPHPQEVIREGQKALQSLSASSHPAERADLLRHLAYLLWTRSGQERNLAVEYLQEAVRLHRRVGDDAALSEALSYLGIVLHTQPQPDYHAAIIAFREAADRKKAPDQQHSRAQTLALLANCLLLVSDENNSQKKADGEKVDDGATRNWSEIARVLGEAVAIFRKEGDVEWLRFTLPTLALSLYAGPTPDWESATAVCREALALLPAPEHAPERAMMLQSLSIALHKKSQPDWDGAVSSAEEAVELLRSQAKSGVNQDTDEAVREAERQLVIIRERAEDAKSENTVS